MSVSLNERPMRVRLRRLVAGAAALLQALGFLGFVAPVASASGPPLISTLVSNSGSCTVSLGNPCASGTADIAAFKAATSPANGDVAIVNTLDDYIYLMAGTTGSEFGLSVTAGDVYLIGGDGSTTSTTLNGPATSSGINIGAVAFDASGNLVLADSAGRSAVDVIARSSTASYGYSSFTPGDLYEVATTGTPASPIITLPSGTTTTFTASSLAIDSYGDIIVAMKSQGIFVIDEQTGRSVAYGQELTPQTATFIAGSPAGGTQITLSSGATALGSGGYIGYPRIALDGYNNLVFTAISSSALGTTNDTVWVLPFLAGVAAGASGTLSGLYGLSSVTAGELYPVAGTPGDTTESLSDVTAGSAAFNDVVAIAVDPAGNIVLGDEGANYSLAVLAESATPAYGIAPGTWTVGNVYTISGGAAATSTSAGPASAFELPPIWTISLADGNLFVAGYNTTLATPAALYEITNAPTEPTPTVGSLNPTSGPVTGGTDVTVTGTGFGLGTAVYFGNALASNTLVAGPTSLTAVSPPGTGSVNVTVTTAGGTSATSSADQFTYAGAPVVPTVTGVSPSTGPAAGDSSVTITGTGFVSGATVDFGTTAATEVNVGGSTSLTATSPPGTGTVDVTITTAGGTSATSSADQFAYTGALAAPTVVQVSPSTGPPTGGTSVKVTGTGFASGATVDFGTVAATDVEVTSSTSLTATSPAGTGTVNVTVTTGAGSSTSSAGDQFTYAFALPTVTGINPLSGAVTGGTVVTVTGTGFASDATVDFGTVAATAVNVLSSTSLTATSPPGTETVVVTVTTSGGTSASSADDQFTYLPAPTVSSVSPASGPVTGGTSVTVSGTGFASGATVDFGTVAATAVDVLSSTSLTATSPAGTEAVDVKVTTGGGTSSASAADQFTYLAAPTVSSVSPASGPVTGGTSVTVSGTGFASGATVDFGTAAASEVDVASPTSLTATSPAGTGTVDLKVTTGGGTSAASNADQFSYTGGPGAPTVTKVSPDNGAAAGGTSVTITGTGFVSGATVDFGSAAATEVNVASPTSLTATSPPGGGAVAVTVSTSGGSSTSTISSADQFVYTGVQISVVASGAGATVPSSTMGVPEAQANISALSVAVNPVSGDEAVLDRAKASVYLIAGKDEPSEYGLNDGQALTAGDAYLVAGKTTLATTLPASGDPATSAINGASVTFDNNGNLLIGMAQTGSSGGGEIDVVPQVSGNSYGTAMSAGDIYTIASVPAPFADSSPTALPQLPGQLTDPEYLAVDNAGNIFVSDSENEIVFIDEATNGTLYGQSVSKGNAYQIAGSLGEQLRIGTLGSGDNDLSTSWVRTGEMTVDANDNVLFTATSSFASVAPSPDTLWVVPATPGVSPGTTVPFPYYGYSSVEAGQLYLVAGTESVTSPEAVNDVAALDAVLDGPDGIALDPSGNVLFSDLNGKSVLVLAESATPGYGISASSWVPGHVYTIDGPANGVATTALPGPASSYQLDAPGDLVSDAGTGALLLVDSVDSGPLDFPLYQISGGPSTAQLVETAGPGGAPASTVLASAAPGTAYTGQLAAAEYAGVFAVTGSNGAVSYVPSSLTSCPASVPTCPAAASVTPGTAYNVQLSSPGGDGATYTETASSASTQIVVSSSGTISAPANLTIGNYTVAGTYAGVSSGNWSFTLTVTPQVTASSTLSVTQGGSLSSPSTLAAGTYWISGTDSNTSGSNGAWAFMLTVSTSSTTTTSTTTINTTTTSTTPVGTTTTTTTPAGVPTVTSVSPDSGPAAGGTSVTISGTGFTSSSIVDFGSTPATDVVFASATSITASSPAGTGTVDVIVTTTAGTSAASTSDKFTYASVPTVGPTGEPSPGPGSTINNALPPPIPVGCGLGTPVSTIISGKSATSLSVSSDGAKAKVTVPRGALPAGTIISVFPVVESAGLALDLLGDQQYLVAFAVSWSGPGGNASVARDKLTLLINDRAIRAGDVVDEVNVSGLKEIEVSDKNATVPVTFRQGRTFVVAGVPIVRIVSTEVVPTSSGAPVSISCVGALPCAGTVSLSVSITAKGAKVGTPVLVAQASFSLDAGVTEPVLLQPTSAGRSLLDSLRASRSMLVTVAETGSPSVTKTLTVQPAKGLAGPGRGKGSAKVEAR